MKTLRMYSVKPPYEDEYLAAVIADDNDNLYTYSNKGGAWEKDTRMHHSDLMSPWYNFYEWDIAPIDENGGAPKVQAEQPKLEKAFREHHPPVAKKDGDDDDDDDDGGDYLDMLTELAKGDKPGHPFRGNQYTGGIGGAAPVADPDAGGLKQYLMMVSSHIEKGDGFASYILKHGKSYAFDDSSFVGGEAHMCFKNSTLAMMTNPDLTYVEGYVSVHGVPIHHAWNVDSNGKVVDTTIKDPTGKLGYYGVPFQDSAVYRTLRKTKYYGMLTDFSAHETVPADPTTTVKP